LKETELLPDPVKRASGRAANQPVNTQVECVTLLLPSCTQPTWYTIHLEDLNIEAIHEGITSSGETRYAPTDHDDSLGHATSSYAKTDRYSATKSLMELNWLWLYERNLMSGGKLQEKILKQVFRANIRKGTG